MTDELFGIDYQLSRVLSGEPDQDQLDIWYVQLQLGAVSDTAESDIVWESVARAELYGMDPRNHRSDCIFASGGPATTAGPSGSMVTEWSQNRSVVTGMATGTAISVAINWERVQSPTFQAARPSPSDVVVLDAIVLTMLVDNQTFR